MCSKLALESAMDESQDQCITVSFPADADTKLDCRVIEVHVNKQLASHRIWSVGTMGLSSKIVGMQPTILDYRPSVLTK